MSFICPLVDLPSVTTRDGEVNEAVARVIIVLARNAKTV
jgi:hypothetical protein